MAKKLNGNIGWMVALLLTALGWAYSIGVQATTISKNEKQLELKANKDVVEECFRSVDKKLDMIIEQLKQKQNKE